MVRFGVASLVGLIHLVGVPPPSVSHTVLYRPAGVEGCQRLKLR
jgi:hypothetical protein